MAPVIWGLPLEEIKWSKFKSSNMWNTRYHLRRTKFIVYQLAMIFSVVGESLGTAALSNYLDEQKFTSTQYPNATVHNNDFVGVFSYNIFSGVFVATVFGAGFFFDLFWPERHEDHGIKLAWKWCAVAACFFQLGAALSTTIIVATHKATITGVTGAQADAVLKQWYESPLSYKNNKRGVAAVVFTWLGFIFVVYATYILWKSYAHNDVHGPLATHVRNEIDVEKKGSLDGSNGFDRQSENRGVLDQNNNSSYAPAIPEPAHTNPHPAAPQHTQTQAPQTSALDSLVASDREAEGPYNVATASTLNGTKMRT